MATIKLGLYQHYKGPFYRVMDVATHSETQEPLVIYQALYGEKGTWARPMSMFVETVNVGGKEKARFAFCEEQTEVLEVAILDIKNGQEADFEEAFWEASQIISKMKGYMNHDLQRCTETSNRYILLVNWQSLEDHTQGFRGSEEYQQWRKLLHHFYQPFPVVEHFQKASLSN